MQRDFQVCSTVSTYATFRHLLDGSAVEVRISMHTAYFHTGADRLYLTYLQKQLRSAPTVHCRSVEDVPKRIVRANGAADLEISLHAVTYTMR